MLVNGEAQKNAIRLDFNKSIFIDFAGAKITSDAGFLRMKEIDQRFGIIEMGKQACGTYFWERLPHNSGSKDKEFGSIARKPNNHWLDHKKLSRS
jgi:hypothetical protein